MKSIAEDLIKGIQKVCGLKVGAEGVQIASGEQPLKETEGSSATRTPPPPKQDKGYSEEDFMKYF